MSAHSSGFIQPPSILHLMHILSYPTPHFLESPARRYFLSVHFHPLRTRLFWSISILALRYACHSRNLGFWAHLLSPHSYSESRSYSYHCYSYWRPPNNNSNSNIVDLRPHHQRDQQSISFLHNIHYLSLHHPTSFATRPYLEPSLSKRCHPLRRSITFSIHGTIPGPNLPIQRSINLTITTIFAPIDNSNIIYS